MGKWVGRAAVFVAISALVPGIVPGAVSLFAIALSMLAMVISICAARSSGSRYTWMTTIVTVAGMLVTNPTFLVWDPAPIPLELRYGTYALVLFLAVVCMLVAHRIDPVRRAGHADASTNRTSQKGTSS